jgi:hypothetical protein
MFSAENEWKGLALAVALVFAPATVVVATIRE